MNIEDYFVSAEEIYVIDTETTGLDGGPRDLVVDVGICSVDLRRGIVKDVYSSIIGHDITDWADHRKKAWIFENTDLTLDRVAAAPPLLKVKNDIIGLLRGRTVTSYNVPFDMDRFLYKEPWSLKGSFNVCTDIMKAATDVCKIPSELYGVSYKFPKLDFAYKTIAPGDPAGVGDKQIHRALSDARMASFILVEMYKKGQYRP